MQPKGELIFILLFKLVTLSSAAAGKRRLSPSPEASYLPPTDVISLVNASGGGGGDIRGFIQAVNINNINSVNVSTYIGIPYARTEGRFSRPVKTHPWKGVQEVTRYRGACPQFDLPLKGETSEKIPSEASFTNANQTTYASEDCLLLNVWSPRKVMVMANTNTNTSSDSTTPEKPTPPLAVMLWIHHSAESRDTLPSRSTIFSRAFDGRRLAATGNVVVVSVAYRVGVFGHLYLPEGETEDGVAQANAGLYDLVEALRWVQGNIALFNGDPQRVTIFGDIGGASSAGVLLLSPATEGLFRRAILQSGSPLTEVDDRHTALAKTRLLGSLVGCSGKSLNLNSNSNGTSNSQIPLSKCLATKPIEKILEASQSMADVGLPFRAVFGVATTGTSETELLPSSPLELLLQGKPTKGKVVDLLFGTTANEGSPEVYDLYPQLDANESLTLEETENLMTNLMLLLRIPFLEEVLDFYLDSLTSSFSRDSREEDRSELLRKSIEAAYGDLITVTPLMLFAELLFKQQENVNSSNRFFAYRLEQPLPVSSSSGCLPSMGVCSGSTVDFVFGDPFFEPGDHGGASFEDPIAEELSRTMMVAWSAFAERGQPGWWSSASPEGDPKWTEAFTNNRTDRLHLMTLKVGGYGMKVEELSSGGRADQNFTCSGASFWRDKIVSMFR